MPNDYFEFKQFTVKQNKTAMKVGTDSVLLGSCVAVCGNETQILDIGAGTGLLALMAAQRNMSAEITAVEIDPLACEQIFENVEASKWKDRIDIINCDINEYKPEKHFDLIISNPPYFSRSLKSPKVEKNFARHDDSLTASDLIACVSGLLSETGRFTLIIPAERANTFVELARARNLRLTGRINIRPNTAKPANRVILEFSFSEKIFEEKTLILRDESGKYSEEYRCVTRDFMKNLTDASPNQ